jgi:hypothetical protein
MANKPFFRNFHGTLTEKLPQNGGLNLHGKLIEAGDKKQIFAS